MIVYCTGYKVSFPFFDEDFISAPTTTCRSTGAPSTPRSTGVYFLGLAQPLGAIMPMAEQQAKWIADTAARRVPAAAARRRCAPTSPRAREAHEKRFYRSKRHTMEVDFDEWMRDAERELGAGRARRARADEMTAAELVAPSPRRGGSSSSGCCRGSPTRTARGGCASTRSPAGFRTSPTPTSSTPGFDEGGVWIVRRTRLRVESFPRFGEPVDAADLLQRPRPLLGRAADVDRAAPRPRSRRSRSGSGSTTSRAARALRRALRRRSTAPAPTGAAPTSASATRSPPPDGERRPWTFRATDIDVAGHVNNSHYWEPLEEQLAGARARRRSTPRSSIASRR